MGILEKFNTETITINNSQIHIDGTLEQLDNTFNIYGNYQDSGDANDAVVTIKNKSNLDHVHGGYSASADANYNADANNNVAGDIDENSFTEAK